MIENLFSTQIWKSSLDVPRSNVKKLSEEIDKDRNLRDLLCVNKWECNIESSFFIENSIDYSPLYSYFIDEYVKFCHQLELKNHEFCIKNIWYNYYLNGYNQEIHNHVNCRSVLYSGVYFLKIKGEHPPITFYNPSNINLFYQREQDITDKLYDYNNIKHSITTNQFSILPKEGDFILFPSYLSHGVSIQKSNIPRVSIAMNFCLQE